MPLTKNLQQPHAVQQIMFKQVTPLLSSAIPSLEMFMSQWEHMQDSKQHLARLIQPGLDKASKYYNCMDDTPAYILAMGRSLPWSYTGAKASLLVWLSASHD